MTAEIIAILVKIVVVIGASMVAVPMFVWLERKVVADFQARIGPNRVGPYGLLQSFYDGIKLLMKEDIHPANVDLALYLAKSEGKQQWRRYISTLHTALLYRLEIRAALEKAITDGGFELH